MKSFSTVCVVASCCLLSISSIGISQQGRAEKKRASRARRAARSLSLLAANGGGALLRPDFESAADYAPLADWCKLNKSALVNAGSNPFVTPLRWGVATTNGCSLYLHITSWPKKGKLVIPRLHNSVVSARFTGQEQELKLTPNVQKWEIAIPEKRTRESFLSVVELKLDRPVQIGTKSPPVVEPGEDNVIRLHSRFAVTRGQMLRFEPQPHKNTVGFWTKEDDWVEWACRAEKDQTYSVGLRYGCGNGQGGSEIIVSVGEQTIPLTVEETGGFQAWKNVSLGEVSGLDGLAKISVRVKEKAKSAVMDIQEITLTPKN